MNENKPLWKLTEELDAIKCPHCEGYDRLSVSVDGKHVYCAECGDSITPEYLKSQCFALPQTIDWQSGSFN